jgi:hypothetical protein
MHLDVTLLQVHNIVSAVLSHHCISSVCDSFPRSHYFGFQQSLHPHVQFAYYRVDITQARHIGCELDSMVLLQR